MCCGEGASLSTEGASIVTAELHLELDKLSLALESYLSFRLFCTLGVSFGNAESAAPESLPLDVALSKWNGTGAFWDAGSLLNYHHGQGSLYTHAVLGLQLLQ